MTQKVLLMKNRLQLNIKRSFQGNSFEAISLIQKADLNKKGKILQIKKNLRTFESHK